MCFYLCLGLSEREPALSSRLGARLFQNLLVLTTRLPQIQKICESVPQHVNPKSGLQRMQPLVTTFANICNTPRGFLPDIFDDPVAVVISVKFREKLALLATVSGIKVN